MPTSSLHAIAGSPQDKRNETELERCDRNLVELLQEVRVVQTGVQVLFAFLLAAPLTNMFHRLGPRQHAEFYVTFVLTGVAALLLIAPTAYHRALFRQGDKLYLVQIANRLTIAGLSAVGASMMGAVTFVTDVLFGPWAALAAGILAAAIIVTFWALLPLARRRELSRTPRPSPRSAG
ncbi:MAG: DUF6328 family protein [Solirubrobacteraceae bacterium]